MSKNSPIEWTHHTFNPWWGCTKVSEACKHCYAEAWSKRVGYGIWGSNGERRFFDESHWLSPVLWNREAEKLRERKRVFCASMADVFEARADLDIWRKRLWKLIEDTPWLDWLLLTKRPENAAEMVPWNAHWPRNVWFGTTVETQDIAQKRVSALFQYPAAVRFISCEPLLEAIELKPWLYNGAKRIATKYPEGAVKKESRKERLDWVIVGGESGVRARPMHPSWVRTIRNQCIEAGVPFLFKQWGSWRPKADGHPRSSRVVKLKAIRGDSVTFVWMGKKAAGRKLDGRTWDEVPVLDLRRL